VLGGEEGPVLWVSVVFGHGRRRGEGTPTRYVAARRLQPWPALPAAAKKPAISTRPGHKSSQWYSCCSRRGGSAGQRRSASMRTCEDAGFTHLGPQRGRPRPRRPPPVPTGVADCSYASGPGRGRARSRPNQASVVAGPARDHVTSSGACGHLQVCC
jgi:hypothetical protein